MREIRNPLKVALTLTTLVCAQLLYAQLEVDNSGSVEEYVQNVLLGAGVTVSNITFNGGEANTAFTQVGSFDGNASNVGLPSGLILGTGDVQGAIGPNDEGGMNEETGLDNNMGNDPDLLSLVGGQEINDWGIIEFDFIPTGDTIRFNYVWASEEYPEFANSDFNDAFGFFLSGPGLNGPFSNNAENIAQIPGTDTAVTINNLNNGDANNGPCEFCEFYVHNGEGFGDPQNSDDTVIQYDGFTVPLEAFALVQCGEEYHIKIAIADVFDDSYDSAVFLEEGSFSSSAPVQAEIIIPGAVEGEANMWESCTAATLNFTRSNTTAEQTLELTLSGTATNGVDYQGIPTSINFAIGQETVSIEFTALTDALVEETETVIIEMPNTSECGSATGTSTFSFNIIDLAPLSTEPIEITVCANEPTAISPSIAGGTGDFTYAWSTGGNTSEITVNPTASTTYSVTVTDQCSNETVEAEVVVNVPPNDLTGTIVTENFSIGCSEEVTVQSQTNGGYNGLTFLWTDQMGNELSTEQNFQYSEATGGEINLTITDFCGNSVSDQIIVTPLNPLQIEAGDDVLIDCDQVVQVELMMSGGEAPYNITWTDGTGAEVSTAQAFNYPAQETNLIVRVTDACGWDLTDSFTITFPEYPISVSLPADVTICPDEEITLPGSATGGYGGLSFSWSHSESTENTITVAPEQFTTYTLTATDLCGESSSDAVSVSLFSIDGQITAIGRDPNEFQFILESNPTCSECSYFWEFGDGQTSEESSPVHTFDGTQSYQVTLSVTTSIGCVQTLTHTIEPAPMVFIPSSFTPNEDGINDVWVFYGIGITEFEMLVYNRWGQIVFQTNDINDAWLGNTHERGQYYNRSDVYSYRCIYKGSNAEAIEEVGSLTILR